jgi:spore coat protein U-like protein
MLLGGNKLNYNLYTSASYATVWGTTAGSLVGFSALLNLGGIDFPVYGVVMKHQFVTPGTYTDTVTITVNY